MKILFLLDTSTLPCLEMKQFILIGLSLASLCQGQSVVVAERFKRLPELRMTLENRDQFPQAESLQALTKFLEETADKRTLTKWFGEPTLLTQRINDSRTPLPENFVTTHLLQDPLQSNSSGGLVRWLNESYFFPIEGTELGILYHRRAHAASASDPPFKAKSQWWGSGNFLAKWPQEKLGPYKDYPTTKLNQWENQQMTAVLKVLWQKLAEDLKE